MELSAGVVLGLVGSGLGIMGGIIGSWATIHAAKGPRQKRLARQLTAIVWIYMALMLAGFVVIPPHWNQGMHLLTMCGCLMIPRANRKFEELRLEDEREQG